MGRRPHVLPGGRVSAADRAAIEAIVADVEAGFNEKDVELLTRHLSDDVTIVNVMGVEVHGKAEAIANAEAGLSGPLADQRARYEVTAVTFVRPDVAIAQKHATAIAPDGTDLDVGHTMTALYVLTNDDGRWWVRARQNTLVPR